MTALREAPYGLSHDTRFRLLWVGEGVSVLGNSTTAVLIPILAVMTLNEGPLALGMLTAAAWLPWLLVGLPAGAWVDRLDARRVMITSDLAAGAALVSIPSAVALGVLTFPHLMTACLITGTCSVFFKAAYPRLVRDIAEPAHQEAAFARLYGTEAACQVAGPGLGGLLAQVFSAAWGLLLDVISFAVSAICLWRLGPADAVPPEREEPVESLMSRISAGIRYVLSDPYMRWFTVIGGVSNLALTGYGALLVLFCLEDLALSEGSTGLLLALGMIGGALGATLATRVSRRWGSARALLRLQLLAGPPALLIGLAQPGAGSILVALGSVGVGMPLVAANIIRAGWRNRYVPLAMVARQVTTSQVVNFGTMPLGALCAGALAGQIGLRTTIVTFAGLHALTCLSILASPVRGLRDMPLPSP